MLTKILNRFKKNQYNSDPNYNSIDKNIYRRYNDFRTLGPQPIFCYVPFNSMTFSFQGKVFACSYNRDVVLGYYPENNIDDIWNSKEANKLREHMNANDLDYGCQHCKYFFEKEKFSNIKPLVWDKYAGSTEAHFPKVLEFELSNECNLECQMCNGEVSSSIRKNRDKLPPIKMPYDDSFVDQLEKYIPHLEEAKFYGGEPFLIDIYYKIWERIAKINPEVNLFVITNGTHWNEKVRNVLERGKFDVAISIDSTKKDTLEKIRKNVRYEKLMQNIDRFTEYCHRRGTYLSLSFTAQKDNWRDFPEYIEFCNTKNAYVYVSYLETPVQFAIPSLGLEELKEIRDYLKDFSFPEKEAWEKHNAQCFRDYRNFIDKYIENHSEKRYLQYKADDNKVNADDYSSFNTDTSPSDAYGNYGSNKKVMQVIGNEKEGLISLLKSHCDEQNIASEEVLNKLLEVVDELSEDEQNRIFAIMLDSDIAEIVTNIGDKPKEILRRNVREALDFVVFENPA